MASNDWVTSPSVEKLHSFDTVYTADSVEWCRSENYRNILLCGTYQLTGTETNEPNADTGTPETKRLGRLLVFNLREKVTADDSSNKYSTELISSEHIDVPAILDLKWSYHTRAEEHPVFAVADALGSVTIWELEYSPSVDFDHQPQCRILETVKRQESGLALSVDWSNAVHQNDEARIVSSFSDGSLALINVGKEESGVVNSWHAHDYEAWISAFDYHSTNIIYSGGDDCKFKTWDVRTSLDRAMNTSNQHSMGVCSIQSNSQREYIVATGSYDENVLLWDTRHMNCPVSRTAVGGGVWRLKWDAIGQWLLAVSMHNGVHVLDCTVIGDSDGQPIVASYMEHNALVYGGDWHQSPVPSINYQGSSDKFAEKEQLVERKTSLVASCSFYEHTLHIWSL